MLDSDRHSHCTKSQGEAAGQSILLVFSASDSQWEEETDPGSVSYEGWFTSSPCEPWKPSNQPWPVMGACIGYMASDWVPRETICIVPPQKKPKRSHGISHKETTRRIQTGGPPGEKAGAVMPDSYLNSDFKRKGHEGHFWTTQEIPLWTFSPLF